MHNMWQNSRVLNKGVNIMQENKLAKIIGQEILKQANTEKTILEYENEGKDITDLNKACQYIYYGFYNEKGNKMKPTELAKYIEEKIERSKGKDNFYSKWSKNRFPEALELVNKWIKKNI